MSMETDPDRRAAALYKRRSETYAIRDLFKAYKRAERPDQEYRNQYLYPFRKSEADRPFRPGYLRRPSTTCLSAADNSRQLFPDIRRQALDSAPCSASSPRRRERAIPYHTAITMPPDKRKKGAEKYDALTCKVVSPLPNVYETTQHLPGYTVRDIKEWKNEVRKIVPARPQLFLPANAVPRDLSIIVPPEIEMPKDSACFFRPTVDKMAGKGKEYMINPEWPSEKFPPESARSRVDCVYTWNV